MATPKKTAVAATKKVATNRERKPIVNEPVSTFVAYMDDESSVSLSDVDLEGFMTMAKEGGSFVDTHAVVISNRENTECVILAWKHVVSAEVRMT